MMGTNKLCAAIFSFLDREPSHVTTLESPNLSKVSSKSILSPKRYPDSLRFTTNAELIFRFLQTSCFYISSFNVFQQTQDKTYALHLMNSLLNIFCYIISNVSIRKNLHMVQLMTESYPDKQNHSKKPCLLRTQGA